MIRLLRDLLTEERAKGYLLAVRDYHNDDPGACGCGGECFRLDAIRRRVEDAP